MKIEQKDVNTGIIELIDIPDNPPNRDDILNQVLNQIDQTTRSMIDIGFSFDGHHFSLSQYAQLNWTALNANYLRTLIQPEIAGILWPVDGMPISTDDNGTYYLTIDKANDFFAACFPLAVGILKSGSDEKNRAMTMRLEDLQNWKDSRLV